MTERMISYEDFKRDLVAQGLISEAELAERDFLGDLLGEVVIARREAGLSQSELARLSGVKQPVISRFETGGTDPKISTIVRILHALGKQLTVTPIPAAVPPREERRTPMPAV